MKIFNALLLIIACGCGNPKKQEIEKRPTEKEIQEELIKIANSHLSYNKEKIVLISAIKEVPYETLYLILRDYYLDTYYTLEGSDSSMFIYEKSIISLSRKHNVPKSKVASLIFSFKYEMITKEEIRDDVVDELKESQYSNEEPIDPQD